MNANPFDASFVSPCIAGSKKAESLRFEIEEGVRILDGLILSQYSLDPAHHQSSDERFSEVLVNGVSGWNVFVESVPSRFGGGGRIVGGRRRMRVVYTLSITRGQTTLHFSNFGKGCTFPLTHLVDVRKAVDWLYSYFWKKSPEVREYIDIMSMLSKMP